MFFGGPTNTWTHYLKQEGPDLTAEKLGKSIHGLEDDILARTTIGATLAAAASFAPGAVWPVLGGAAALGFLLAARPPHHARKELIAFRDAHELTYPSRFLPLHKAIVAREIATALTSPKQAPLTSQRGQNFLPPASHIHNASPALQTDETAPAEKTHAHHPQPS